MNLYLFIAAILIFLLGLVHSLLGEYLIFRTRRTRGNLVPSLGSKELKERHLRIIWASWHALSIMGWCIGTILLTVSLRMDEMATQLIEVIKQPITYAMFISSILVLVGTKGKHPGWIILLIIGLLTLFSI